jgi:hypothetical protein
MRCSYQSNSFFDMGWSYKAIWFLLFVKGQAGARNHEVAVNPSL